MNQSYFDVIFIGCKKIGSLPKKFAILTACNPMDEILKKTENKKLNQGLRRALSEFEMPTYNIIGSSPDLNHQEPSFLIEIPENQAIEVAASFNQRAIFWVSNDQMEIIECSTRKRYPAGSFSERTRRS